MILIGLDYSSLIVKGTTLNFLNASALKDQMDLKIDTPAAILNRGLASWLKRCCLRWYVAPVHYIGVHYCKAFNSQQRQQHSSFVAAFKLFGS